ncbi:MAG: rod shape-determining protein MreD [Roseburia sp.]|nr:rod shape-determining protein MreD [Roseburia sp.]
MLRKVIVTITILACFILQSSVFTSLSLGGIIPNLMIIITAAFGFMRGEKEGLVIGFVSGLLSDVFYGEILGLYALFLMYIGFLNGKFSRIFYPEDIKLPLALISVSDLSYGMLCYILLFLLKERFDVGWYLMHVILPEVLYTIIVTLFLYPLVLKLNKMLEAREKRRAQKFV